MTDNIYPVTPEQIVASLRRQSGTAKCLIAPGTFSRPSKPRQPHFEVVAGAHWFRIEAGEGTLLNFYHASPGTGTRIATVDLAAVRVTDYLAFYFDWSPNTMNFSLRDDRDPTNAVSSIGKLTKARRYVIPGGLTLAVAPGTLQMAMTYQMQDGTHHSFRGAAIEAWEAMAEAVNVALSGESSQSAFNFVISNMSLVMLATGFETYLETRFVEMEAEGLAPDLDALAGEFMRRDEKSADDLTKLESNASANGRTVFAELAERINFLSWDRSKTAYRLAYGIRFGDIAASPLLERVQKVLEHRGRIVHETAMDLIMDAPKRIGDPPVVISTRDFAKESRARFDTFIRAVHRASLPG